MLHFQILTGCRKLKRGFALKSFDYNLLLWKIFIAKKLISVLIRRQIQRLLIHFQILTGCRKFKRGFALKMIWLQLYTAVQTFHCKKLISILIGRLLQLQQQLLQIPIILRNYSRKLLRPAPLTLSPISDSVTFQSWELFMRDILCQHFPYLQQ